MFTIFSQPKTMHVNNWDLHYIEQGKGPAVVFLHGGGPTDYRTWGLQVEPFAQHFHSVAYSLRYHYPNAWIGDGSDYSTQTHANDLAGLITSLGLAPVNVVTSSYGGDVALLLTSQQPHLVHTLVLGEPPLANWLVKLVPEQVRAEATLTGTWEDISMAVQKGDLEQGVRLFASLALGEGVYDRLPEATRRRMHDNARILALPEPSISTNFSFEDAADIEVPTLLLTGDRSPKQFLISADELARRLPHVERATIPQASHLLHGMNPDTYNKTVLAYLARQKA